MDKNNQQVHFRQFSSIQIPRQRDKKQEIEYAAEV